MGCDYVTHEQMQKGLVSIHAPTWGATQARPRLGCLQMFQSTHPHGVRPIFRSPGLFYLLCFNPRTHMGCDMQRRNMRKSIGVSIHAPTWGATSSVISCCISSSGFNPRTHMGCDFSSYLFFSMSAVSIHAPTWGATRYKLD